jgi:hypothetical protein
MSNPNGIDLGPFLGGIIGTITKAGVTGVESAADSLLEDAEKTLTGATKRVQKARVKIRVIKQERNHGGKTE